MATTSLKKRVETIEEKIPRKPCKRHPGPLIFIQGSDDPDGRLVDKKVAELERCRRCDGRKKLVIKLERFDAKKNLPPVQFLDDVVVHFEKFEPPVSEPKPVSGDPIHFTLADGEKIFGEVNGREKL